MPAITVSAVVLTDTQGRVLTVRKRGTSSYMFPGGKPEPGETASAAAVREVFEELGLELVEARLEYLGRWETTAANEAGYDLIGEIFRWNDPITHPDDVLAHAEIEELLWLAPEDGLDRSDIAPLTRECVFPTLCAG